METLSKEAYTSQVQERSKVESPMYKADAGSIRRVERRIKVVIVIQEKKWH
jgi:hypothetical protein